MLVLLGLLALASAQAEETGFVPLFNGKDLTGWHVQGGDPSKWTTGGGSIVCNGKGGGWLSTDKEYGDFTLKMDWKIEPGGNSGVALRFPSQGLPAYEGMEVQILDDKAPAYKKGGFAQFTGSIFGQVEPDESKKKLNPPGQWNSYEITCQGPLVVIALNGVEISRVDLDKETNGADGRKPLSQRPRKGLIGMQSYTGRVEFRNILIREIGGDGALSKSKDAEPAPAASTPADRIKEIKKLMEQGLIDKQEYDRRVKEILDAI